MDLKLPYELQGLRTLVREFVNEQLVPLEDELRDHDDLPAETWERLKNQSLELGLYTLAEPEEYGGGGINELGQALVAEEMGRVAIGFRHLVNHLVGARVIYKFGSDYLRENYGKPLMEGKKRAAWCVTEPSAGSDLSGILTQAVRQGDYYIINGMKHFMTDVDRADFVLLAVYTNRAAGFREGLSFFVVDKNTPGFKIGRHQRTMGREGLHSFELYFDDMKVPAANLIGAEGMGRKVLFDQVHHFRLELGGTCCGTARRFINMAAEYAQQRVQFKRPISEFQAIQWMLADAEIDLYATRMLVYSTACKVDNKVAADTDTAMVKAYAPEMAGRAVDSCMQIHGAVGYERELQIEAVYRALRVLRIAEGSAEINRGIIARNLIKGTMPWDA